MTTKSKEVMNLTADDVSLTMLLVNKELTIRSDTKEKLNIEKSVSMVVDINAYFLITISVVLFLVLLFLFEYY